MFLCSVIRLSYIFSPVLLILIVPGHEIHDDGKRWHNPTNPSEPACCIQRRDSVTYGAVWVFEDDNAAVLGTGLRFLVSNRRVHAAREHNLAITVTGTGSDVRNTTATNQDFSRSICPFGISTFGL